jgi:5-oxoprolinase (ATP-hydrolysing) subunit B
VSTVDGVDIVSMGTHSLHARLEGYHPAALAVALRDLNIDGVSDVVPAETTLLVRCENHGARESVLFRLEEVIQSLDQFTLNVDPSPIEIAVRYDGEDLSAIAQQCGISIEETINRHVAGEYLAEFCGFAPGFAYLSGLDPVLQIPRRDTPRTRVPAGSVSIAAMYSAVYPSESPGGWHLIGSTSAAVWNAGRNPPALIEPGRRVRFVRE